MDVIKRTQGVLVGFVVNKVALEYFILRVSQFCPVGVSVSTLDIYLFMSHRCHIISLICSVVKYT
jgi:hypothetical protein